MSFYRINCPHCKTESVSFKSIAIKRHISDKNLYTVFFYCNHCEDGIVLLANCATAPDPHAYEGDLNDYPYCKILKVSPTFKSPEIPDHLPKQVEKLFKQAASNAQKSGFEESTGMMCRKTLEKALSDIAPETNGSKLYKRIEKCAEKQLITPAMKDWAHIIRDEGNDAAHEELNPEQAKDLLNFTYMFLVYTFTLPGMMLDRQQKKQ